MTAVTREALLHANHIHSFAPALKFAEQFASADELAAHRTFKRDRFRSDLWPDPDFDERFLKARDEAERRRMRFGSIWEGQIEPFRVHYMKMLVQARSELLRMRQPYEEERDELFREEVDRFSSDLSQSEEWVGQKRSEFGKAVFAALEPAAGLWLDRKLASKVSPVFSRNLARDWKASLHINGSHLNSPYRKPSIDPATGGPERRVGRCMAEHSSAQATRGRVRQTCGIEVRLAFPNQAGRMRRRVWTFRLPA